MPELSFMHIYGQRAQVPGSVIIDGMCLETHCVHTSYYYSEIEGMADKSFFYTYL